MNLKKNAKVYLPYLLTCILTVLMFYTMNAITRNKGLLQVPGANSLMMVLDWALIVTGMFAAVFLFYTNSFLVKQRKKEFGIYQVLGMDKRNLIRMMCWETLMISLGSLICGLIGGILLGKLMFLILLKLLRFSVVLKFTIELQAMIQTVVLFAVIFLCTLLFNMIQVCKVNPVELLHGGNQGEREPKTKWLLTCIGVITLGSGYFIAQTTEAPLQAINKFFIAVILVVIGTYALFVAGSVAILKGLKKNKNYYYHPRHFISVSGMIYRMKQNAVGLANICIMSTIVLVLISISFSLYAGMEDVMDTRFPKEFLVEISDDNPENIERCTKIVEEESKSSDVKLTDHVQCHYMDLGVLQTENQFAVLDDDDGSSYQKENYCVLYVIPLSDYNQMEKTKEELKEGEVLFYMPGEEFAYDSLELEEEPWKVKKILQNLKIAEASVGNGVVQTVYIVVPNESSIAKIQDHIVSEDIQMNYTEYFDLEGNTETRSAVMSRMKNRIAQEVENCWVEYRESFSQEFYSLYGGFLFLGIFVGALFLMATVLIIYYKQISEGYDDRERFQIMQKVGMSKQEVKKSIHSQVLLVFFLPLLVAVLHVAAAFKVMTKLLAILNLVNVQLFLFCTIGIIFVFAIFYGITFLLTSREYYRIVN